MPIQKIKYLIYSHQFVYLYYMLLHIPLPFVFSAILSNYKFIIEHSWLIIIWSNFININGPNSLRKHPCLSTFVILSIKTYNSNLQLIYTILINFIQLLLKIEFNYCSLSNYFSFFAKYDLEADYILIRLSFCSAVHSSFFSQPQV